MLFVVTDQVMQGEAIVSGHKINAGRRTPAIAVVQIARSGEPIGKVGKLAFVTLPITAHGIAITAVPLGPSGGEIADLIAAVSDVPGLRDQLHLRDDRVLMNDIEESREAIDIV